MKRLIFLLLALPLISFTSDTNLLAKKTLVGQWIGADGGDVGFITFEKDGYLRLKIGQEEIGGKEFEMDGVKAKMTYEVNYKSDPIEVDFIFEALDGSTTRRMLCIAEFINKDEIKFASDFSKVRPLAFTPENSIVFKRLKD